MSETKTFFNDLFGGYRELGFIELRSLSPRPDGGKNSFAAFYDSVDHFMGWHQQERISKADLYFGVLPRYRKSSYKSAVAQARVLWVDIDAKDKSKEECFEGLYRGSTPSPSYVVDSGGGIHAYWLLSDIETDVQRIEDTCFGLARSTRGDYCHNADRILRVPGTSNFKLDGNPRPVKIIASPAFRYSLEDFKRYEVIGSGRRLSAEVMGDIVPEPVSLEQLYEDLPDFLVEYVQEGIDADIHNTFKGDRSRLDFYIISKLLKNGFTPEQVAGILTDPAYAISHKTLSRQGRSRTNYLSVSIGKAQALINEERSEGVTA